MSILQIGSAAPNFTLADQDGVNKSLADFLGSFVVVYFYPKDDTAGCTTEACAIRDSYGEFSKLGAVVLGISADSPESHKKFGEKYNLPFTLLSDPEKTVIKAYGAKSILGIKRISYLLDKKGVIAKVYPNVDPSTHAQEILKDLTVI